MLVPFQPLQRPLPSRSVVLCAERAWARSELATLDIARQQSRPWHFVSHVILWRERRAWRAHLRMIERSIAISTPATADDPLADSLPYPPTPPYYTLRRGSSWRLYAAGHPLNDEVYASKDAAQEVLGMLTRGLYA